MDEDLLNDLNDLDDDDGVGEEDGGGVSNNVGEDVMHDLDTSDEGEGGSDGDDMNVETYEIKKYDKVSSLLQSERYKKHIISVHEAIAKDKDRDVNDNPIRLQSEHDGEYKIIIATNKLLVDSMDEMFGIHKYLIDTYKKKFPELDALIPNPMDYAKVVHRLRNEMDMTVVDLDDLLPPTTVMAVSVTGSATSGVLLSPDELKRALEACEEMFRLDEDRNTMINFVGSRMHLLAPNISAIVGSGIAAQLVGTAGGLNELASMPACNIEVLGKQKKSLAGFGRATGLIHAGHVYNCEIVQEAPVPLRKKANKFVAAKIKLAASVDVTGSRSNGSYGEEVRKDILQKLENLAGPGTGRQKKALPLPIEKSKKKRGGKRARKFKEMTEQTELRKLLNRTAFGSANDAGYADDAMGVDYGMLGKDGSGKVRFAAGMKESKLGQKAAKRLKTNQLGSLSTSKSGFETSIAFTPVQGFELEDPTAKAAKLKAANDKYFSHSSGFMSTLKPGFMSTKPK